ncbi:High osmolarity signaling protein SHO1 [Mycena venus]|uniref:High osmolarity signaling protein SHO1 n=1 Tax=Mycena venus TaxID=2733690 RepID=A0A8H6X3K4_9AGAR|nr:High osmolarity signaling protein SHO1 [Mycena venus]
MATTKALVLWDPYTDQVVAKIDENSQPEGGRWALVLNALVSGCPGRTLDHVYSSLGAVLEKQANRAAYSLGLGPHVVAQKIKSSFGNGEDRVQRLELLRSSTSQKLEKKCLKLLKYTMPTESANMQCHAFKETVNLATLFPGLRMVFLYSKFLDGATAREAISALWDRSPRSSNDEWVFWQTLAATSLTETTISAIIEETSISDLTDCQEAGLSVIEKLLIEHNSSGASPYSSALCIRYLSAILHLPGFWLNAGTIHGHVANKLCCEMVVLLKDIGVDILALGPIDVSEGPFDYDGVDLLATILLTGILNWFAKLERQDWIVQPWCESFTTFLQLLRMPRAAELLPKSFTFANSNFEDIVPTSYKEAKLNVTVDSENHIDTPDSIHNDPVADLHCKNDSTTNVHSRISDHNDGQCPSSDHEDHSDTWSEILSVDSSEALSQNETEISSTSDAKAYDFNDDADFEVHNLRRFESGPYLGGSSYLNQDLALGNAVGVQSLQNSPLHPSPEARRKEAEEHKIILVQSQKDLGDYHPSTLQAMEDLARTYYELGEFMLARDLRVVVLEKRKIQLGEEHPNTLRSMGALGLTYGQLGQHNEAESLQVQVLEKQRKLLGEDHPYTLWAVGNLATTYEKLGFPMEAKSLIVQVLEVRREVLGEGHPDIMRTMGGLASTYNDIDQLKEAESLLVQELKNQRMVLGEEHPETLRIMGNLASTYQELGQFTEAESLWAQVLKKWSELLGDNHPDTLWAMGHLATTYLKLGRLSAAEEIGLAVLEKKKKISGQ